MIEKIIMAFEGVVAVARTPIARAPRGPNPIARVTIPKARPRISGELDEITMIDCSVPNPATHMPRRSRNG